MCQRIATSLATSLAMVFAASALAQRPAPKLDHYGDPLPPGAVARLGTKRFQTKGGFGWTPDGKSLATLRGGTVYFWDLADGHCRETLLVPVNPDPFFTYGTKFVLSKDGQRLVCADRDGALATWDLATSQMASLPGDAMRRNEENAAIALHPNGKQFVTLRLGGEIQFRDFATCQVQRAITPKAPTRWHEDAMVAFSPDGKTLVLHTGSGTSILIVGVEKGEERSVVQKAHGYSLNHLEFLADGRLLSVGTRRGPAAAADPQPRNQLLIWDVTQDPPTSRELALGDDLAVADCSAAFSADGKTLVTVNGNRIAIWDVAGEKIVRTIEGSKFRNAGSAIVQVDPTGKYIAVDDRQNYVRVWEVATGKAVLSTEQHHQAAVYGADWSPDGMRVATGAFDGEGRVWDAATGEPLVRFRGPNWGVFALRYTSDGTQIVVCGDEPAPGPPRVGAPVTGPVRWHDAESGKLLQEISLPARARLLTPSPDWSQLAVAPHTAGRDEVMAPRSAIHLLDAKTGNEKGRFDIDVGGWELNALAWSADGTSLLAATSKKVVHTEVATGRTLFEIELPHFRLEPESKLLLPSGFYRAAFVGGAAVVTYGGLPEIYGWQLPAGEKLWTVKSDDDDVRVLTASPDAKLLAATFVAADKSARLRLFDLATRRVVATFDLGRDSAERAVFSPDGNRLMLGCIDGTALIYDVADFR